MANGDGALLGQPGAASLRQGGPVSGDPGLSLPTQASLSPPALPHLSPFLLSSTELLMQIWPSAEKLQVCKWPQ